MRYKYTVEGMTCGGCVASVKSKLLGLEVIDDVKVQLDAPQVEFEAEKQVALGLLQQTLGKYRIQPIQEVKKEETALPEINVTTYKPLLLIVSFIAGASMLTQYPFLEVSWMEVMRFFMAGFFIVFAFFKLLNLSGFANSYSMYDIVAAKWKSWGYIYPFVELVLGVMYFVNVFPWWTNVVTVVVLSVSIIGVIQSNLAKRKIKCACLGDVFNLPMSTVTIIEDAVMIIMALGMLLVA